MRRRPFQTGLTTSTFVEDPGCLLAPIRASPISSWVWVSASGGDIATGSSEPFLDGCARNNKAFAEADGRARALAQRLVCARASDPKLGGQLAHRCISSPLFEGII